MGIRASAPEGPDTDKSSGKSGRSSRKSGLGSVQSSKLMAINGPQQELLQEIFAKYDTKNTGKMDRSWLPNAMIDLDLTPTDAQMECLVQKLMANSLTPSGGRSSKTPSPGRRDSGGRSPRENGTPNGTPGLPTRGRSGSQSGSLSPRERLSSRERMASKDPNLEFWEFEKIVKLLAASQAYQIGKFELDTSFRTEGYIDTFTLPANLEEMVGRCDPILLRGIYVEHVLSPNSFVDFVPIDYPAMVTSPKKEFFFVAGDVNTSVWELNVNQMPAISEKSRHGRKAVKLGDLLQHENARRFPQLRPEEVLVGRLYSGPMSTLYNQALRASMNKLKDASSDLGTMYPTTIHVLQSLILKLRQSSRAPYDKKVYLSVDSNVLPPEFYQPDEQGFKSGMELGFLSATKSRSVAESRSRSRNKNKSGNFLVCQMTLGKATMGADIGWLSFYPEEQEMLFPCCSQIEILGKAPEYLSTFSSARVIHIQPTFNQTSKTVEQLKTGRKSGVETLTRSIGLELESFIKTAKCTGVDAETIQGIQAQVHLSDPFQEGEWYNNLGNLKFSTSRCASRADKICKRLSDASFREAVKVRKAKGSRPQVVCLMSQSLELLEHCEESQHVNNRKIEVLENLCEATREKSAGTPVMAAAQIRYKFANELMHGGRPERALKEFQNVLLTYKTELGAGHLSVAMILNQMGHVYVEQHKYQTALKCFNEALGIRREVLGNNHYDVATLLHSIASTHDDAKNFQKALEVYRESLDVKKKLVGERHLDVAAIYCNMGRVFRAMGDFKKALEYSKRDLQISRELLGDDHIDLATTLCNTACVLEDLKQYADAITLVQEAVHIRRARLGSEHLEVVFTQSSLAELLRKAGQKKEAKDLFQYCRAVYEKVYGADHQRTIAAATEANRCESPTKRKTYN